MVPASTAIERVLVLSCASKFLIIGQVGIIVVLSQKNKENIRKYYFTGFKFHTVGSCIHINSNYESYDKVQAAHAVDVNPFWS